MSVNQSLAEHLHIGWAREDAAHDLLVKTLARRVVTESIEWLDDDMLEHMWRWAGFDGEQHHKLSSTPRLTLQSGRPIRRHGKINGEALAPEARMYRTILERFGHEQPRPVLVIIARDGDGRAEQRRRGFRQVVEGLTWPFEVVLALPEPESEAWFVCGFEPRDSEERARLDALKRELSFDPTMRPTRLTARPNDAPTDAKKVLARLTASDPDRQRACIAGGLAELAERGRQIGLEQFLDDLRRHLLAHFPGPPPAS